MIDKIFRTIFSLIALPIFIITALIAFIAYFIVFNFFPKEKASKIAHCYVSQTWGKILYSLILVRVKIANKNRIDKNKVYVFVSNHRSLLDVPVWAFSMDNAIRFLSKEEMTKLPVFGYVIKRLYISVNRADKNDRARSISKMKASLDEGISVFLAPEGTRNKGGIAMQDFKDGAFRLAVAAQTPIAALVLYNTDNLLSPKTLFGLKPGTIHGTWLPVLETTGLTENDIPVIKQKVWQLMHDEYLRLEKEFGK